MRKKPRMPKVDGCLKDAVIQWRCVLPSFGYSPECNQTLLICHTLYCRIRLKSQSSRHCGFHLCQQMPIMFDLYLFGRVEWQSGRFWCCTLLMADPVCEYSNRARIHCFHAMFSLAYPIESRALVAEHASMQTKTGQVCQVEKSLRDIVSNHWDQNHIASRFCIKNQSLTVLTAA